MFRAIPKICAISAEELSRIWNAFLRGQIIIFILTAITYTIVLGILGIRYAIGIAFLAGLAKFLPYVGPFITWTTLALVAYYQPATIFGLSPLAYALMAVVLGILIDQIFDNLITPANYRSGPARPSGGRAGGGHYCGEPAGIAGCHFGGTDAGDCAAGLALYDAQDAGP